jgi:hypothetical protein
MLRRTWLFTAVLVALALQALAAAPTPGFRLLDLDNHFVDPFQVDARTRAIVFVFISVECPVSNRYAPELIRLRQRFGPRGVEFRFVYPNPSETPAGIRAHLKDYGFADTALRDPRQELAKFAAATITPEAAVYDTQLRRLYIGRIDDRYVSLGLERPAATRHDLEDALTAVLAGKPVPAAGGAAVGCFIADFAR